MPSQFDFEATRTLSYTTCLRCERPLVSTAEHPLCSLCQVRPVSPSVPAKRTRKRAA
jgi:hypothetical protein